MTRRDLALLDEDDRVAALVTITPMGGDDCEDIADEARAELVEHFRAETTPVEVGRDE